MTGISRACRAPLPTTGWDTALAGLQVLQAGWVEGLQWHAAGGCLVGRGEDIWLAGRVGEEQRLERKEESWLVWRVGEDEILGRWDIIFLVRVEDEDILLAWREVEDIWLGRVEVEDIWID
jgi:hypothetical protein